MSALGFKMAPGAPKAGGGEGDESSIRWLISYSDFMMQLVCLFILLYSVSSVDVRKASVIVEAWRGSQGLPLLVRNAPLKATAAPMALEELPEALQEIQLEAGRHPEGRCIRIVPTSDGFRLQILAEMFPEGLTQMGKSATETLDLATELLAPYGQRVALIEIIGHTAPGPNEADGALRLSLGRAHEAFRWVTRPGAPHRLDERRLSAAGVGPYDPAEDDSRERTRVLNRRIDFAVHLIAPPQR